MEGVDGLDDPRKNMGQAREHTDGERTVEEAQRVEEARQIQGEDRGDQDEGQDVILPGDARLLLPFRPEEFRLLEDVGEELVHGAQRTDPAAGHPAEDDRHDDRDPRQGQGGEEDARGDQRRQGDQGIEVEKALDRLPDVVVPGVMADGEKIHEQAEESRLRRHAQDLKNAMLPRLFSFQFSASPGRTFRGPARGPTSGKGVPRA